MAESLQMAPGAPPTAKVQKRASSKREREKEPFAPEGADSAAHGAPPPSVGGNRSILVVDDHPVVLKAFELKLKANGFAVTTSSNPATVATVAQQSKAELIILDIHFHGGSGVEWTGFTVMQWLRRFPDLAKIPVILITGGEAAKYKDKALAEGAAAFFEKPVNYQDLLATMLTLLSRV